jgi:endonuclease YncB( thermonuclease family)
MAESNEPREDHSTTSTVTVTLVILAVVIVLAWYLKRRAAERQPVLPKVEQTVGTGAGVPATAADPRIPRDEEGKPLSDYQILTPGGCRLMDDPGNGGDAFKASTPQGTHRFRLYWVRTAAVNAGEPGSARDVIDHFGLRDENELQEVAKDAAKFTLSLLRARPFRIVTRWEKEAGDDAFLCFVYLDNGEGGWQNLSSWLVRSGLAMIVPCERDLPEPKVSAAEYQKQLETDEAEAKHSRTGAWAR